MELDKRGGGRRYRNGLDCINQVLRQEGIKGIYRELGASYLDVARSALHLTLYEQSKMGRRGKETISSGSIIWETPPGKGFLAGFTKVVAILCGYPA